MTSKCCVCGKVIKALIDGTPDDGIISHGYCGPCAEEAKKELKALNEMSGHLQWEGWSKPDP